MTKRRMAFRPRFVIVPPYLIALHNGYNRLIGLFLKLIEFNND